VKSHRTVLGLDPVALSQLPGYEPLRPGVDILYLYEDAESGASSALLRYEPGARVPEHRHEGYEHVFVLSGEQRDERGSYAAGTFVINPPGTSHEISSPEGCLVLIIWQRPVTFTAQAPPAPHIG
jgi:anti-sigma factor ChrR (cupin superfamily)